MSVDVIMPQMGESIAEATILKWLKKPGDSVEKDETILEISTDKVDSEIPSPASGVIVELLHKEGDVVPVKAVIARISSDGKEAVKAPPAEKKAEQKIEEKAEAPRSSSTESTVSNGSPHSQSQSSSSKFYSPLVKSLAEKHRVSLAELDAVSGSGAGGRLNKEDFLRYVETKESRPSASAPSVVESTRSAKSPSTDFPVINDWAPDGTKIIPMDTMRQAIADHMVRSKHTSPHVYSVQEVDVTNIAQWRKAHKDEFQKVEGFNLSFTPFFLEATVKALLKFPYVNASVGEKKIILKRNINLGCAVALGNTGLIVPVIKRAEEKNFVGLARSLNDLALRARNKKLLPDDVAGGTFTVTNPGVFGTVIGTPIINQPQVAILCLGAIVKRPVVINDMIAIREMCYLTLSYDHRIVDGSLGGQFLAFLREYLEGWDPKRALN
jgi:2-oxoglutarate dehydrogenase E2 component (dihydrolipoamide succinyltransferase)